MRLPEEVLGNTTDNYVAALTINMSGMSGLAALIKNTGTKDLDLKIVTKIKTIEYEELGETALTAGSLLRYFEKDSIGTVIFYVKSLAAGNPTTYTIECMGS